MRAIELPVRAGFYLSEIRRRDRAILERQLLVPEIREGISIAHEPGPRSTHWTDVARVPTRIFGRLIRNATRGRHTGMQNAMLAIRDDAGKPIGAIGANGSSIQGACSVELGAWLEREYWGRGIMTDAMRAYVRYAFDELHLVKLSAQILQFNAAAIRMLEKNRFRLEGHMRHQYIRAGRPVDAYLYGLIESDLAELCPAHPQA